MYDSKLEEKFHKIWTKSTNITLTPQHMFHPRRKWRFDFAHLPSLVAIEIQGWGEGHNSYEGMRSDYYKHNEAVRHGWSILYIMSADLEPKAVNKTIGFLVSVINNRHKGLIEELKKLKLPSKPLNKTPYQRTIDRILHDKTL